MPPAARRPLGRWMFTGRQEATVSCRFQPPDLAAPKYVLDGRQNGPDF
jgi:hypothetical protein